MPANTICSCGPCTTVLKFLMRCHDSEGEMRAPLRCLVHGQHQCHKRITPRHTVEHVSTVPGQRAKQQFSPMLSDPAHSRDLVGAKNSHIWMTAMLLLYCTSVQICFLWVVVKFRVLTPRGKRRREHHGKKKDTKAAFVIPICTSSLKTQPYNTVHTSSLRAVPILSAWKRPLDLFIC